MTMTPEELEDVRADVWAEPWKDPSLFPDCLSHVVTELGALATGERYIDLTAGGSRLWAAQLLRTLRHRASSGVPFGEPWGDQPPPPEDL